MTTLVAANDASFTVDGLSMTRPTNVVTDALPGVTLDLTGVTAPGSVVTVSVGVDGNGTAKKIQDLVSAYNAIVTAIRARSQPGTSGKPGGPLLADFAAEGAKQRLRSAIASAQGSGVVPNLASIGVATQRDGTLQVDAATLAKAVVANPTSVSALVADAATKLSDVALNLGTGPSSLFQARSSVLDKAIRNLDRQIAQKQQSLDKIEQALTQKFSTLETLIARFKAQGSFLSQQLTNGTTT
jgi:flagellar hook-associated protein 2